MGAMSSGLQFLIETICGLYAFVIFLRILLELVQADYYNPLSQFVIAFTNRPVKLLQRLLPRLTMIDLPAVVLLLLVELVKLLLLSVLITQFPNLIGLLLLAIAELFAQLVTLYIFLIIIFAVLTWVSTPRLMPLLTILHSLVNPLLKLVRRWVPTVSGIDLSPIIVIMVLYFINIVLFNPFVSWARLWAFY